MSLPSLVALPTSLQFLVTRAEEAFLAAAGSSSIQAGQLAAWPPKRRESFGRVCAASDFVNEQVSRDPEMLLQLAESGLLERGLHSGEMRAALADMLDGCADDDGLARQLRRFRNRQQVRIIWRDLTRQADLAETCGDLSDMADACIDLAYQWLYARHCEQFGVPTGRRSGQAQHMVILGMGKLGARELNLSSDIDLIFGYPEGGETVGAKRSLDNQEFFVRLGQRLIKALSGWDAEGRVLLLTRGYDDNFFRSGRNVARLTIKKFSDASSLDVLRHDVVVVEDGAWESRPAAGGNARSAETANG